jgi:acetylornithine deacetylase
MSTARQRLFDAIAAREDELIHLTQRLVREPSVLGNEMGAQRVVADYLRAGGLEPDVWELPESVLELPGAGNSGVPFTGRHNVAAALPGAGGGRSLVLNGHVDVVSPEPLANWARDPWAAEIVGRRMYGRGAYDMKSGLAVNLFLARLLTELGIQLKGDLSLESVIEEECTGNGTLASLRAGVLGDAVLLPEPTDLELLVGGSGVLWCDFAVSGHAGHAHSAEGGANPILACLGLVAELQALESELNAARADGEERCVINVGTIEGGDWRSSAPTGARLGVRVGFPAAWDAEAAQRAVRTSLERATSAPTWPPGVSVRLSFDGFRALGYALDPDHSLARALADAHESVHGGRPRPFRLASTTDARHYLNELALPALCYGPRVRNIHGVDEAVELASIVAGARTLTRFIPAFMNAT